MTRHRSSLPVARPATSIAHRLSAPRLSAPSRTTTDLPEKPNRPIPDHFQQPASGPPLARRRIQDLLDLIQPGVAYDQLDDDAIFEIGEEHGYFVNVDSLEPVLFREGLAAAMQAILLAELGLGPQGREALTGWVQAPDTLDAGLLVRLIERIGKGRFAQLLAPSVDVWTCPDYIRRALERICHAVA
jgi:putative ATP-dependent endonuclease of OLD family